MPKLPVSFTAQRRNCHPRCQQTLLSACPRPKLPSKIPIRLSRRLRKHQSNRLSSPSANLPIPTPWSAAPQSLPTLNFRWTCHSPLLRPENQARRVPACVPSNRPPPTQQSSKPWPLGTDSRSGNIVFTQNWIHFILWNRLLPLEGIRCVLLWLLAEKRCIVHLQRIL